MKLKCVVIDDSAVQRMTIAKLVNNHPNLHLIGDFSNAIEARKYLAIYHVDVVFLDIEMPVISGFDFLDDLKIKPQIIFITSKAEYAMKAFDYDATDYLQKPVAITRFNASVKRAFDLQLLRANSPKADGDHIFIRTNLQNLKIFTAKIKWIESFGDYIKVVTEEDTKVVHSTLKSFEKELAKDKFVRVHKSYIINADKVERYDSKFAEIGPTKIPLSRTKKQDLARALAVN